jgi:hypothetical protein
MESDLTNVFDRDLAAFDRSLQKAATLGGARPWQGSRSQRAGPRCRRYFVLQLPFQLSPVRPSFHW